MTVNWEIAGRTHAGNKRSANEDALLIDGKETLWAVADGMGGHEAGDIASHIVIEELRTIALSQIPPERLLAETRKKLHAAADRIQKYAAENCEGRKIGSTLVCLMAQDCSLDCVWAGDSRLYRMRDNVLEQLTEDHSEVAELVALGLITEEEAKSHPNKNVITRTIGAGSSSEVEHKPVDFQSGDIFLLCSDGLYNELGISEISCNLATGTLDEMATELLRCCLDTQARDNVSFILLRVTRS